MNQTPTEAVASLKAAEWTEARIGEAVGVNQSTIHRIGHGAEPAYGLGVKLIELARKEAKKQSANS